MYSYNRSVPQLGTDNPSPVMLRAFQRRQVLVTPDRRTFIQSMSNESARRISGNGVPAHTQASEKGGSTGVFAYTFPAQRFSSTPYSISSSSFYHRQSGGSSSPGPSARGPAATPYQQSPSVSRQQISQFPYVSPKRESGSRGRGPTGLCKRSVIGQVCVRYTPIRPTTAERKPVGRLCGR